MFAASLFVRSVSQHGVGQLMLASPPGQWNRLLHIPLGIDPEAYPARRARTSATFDLLTVGRLSPEKGHRILLAARALLGERKHSARLYIVGDGPDRGALEEGAARLGLEQVVEFAGWVGTGPAHRQAPFFGYTAQFGGLWRRERHALPNRSGLRPPAAGGDFARRGRGSRDLIFAPREKQEPNPIWQMS